MLMVLFLGGMQLLTLGIFGEYLGRVYDEGKARPLFLIARTVGFIPENTGAHIIKSDQERL